MRSIVDPLELTVRLVADAKAFELLIVLHLQLEACLVDHAPSGM